MSMHLGHSLAFAQIDKTFFVIRNWRSWFDQELLCESDYIRGIALGLFHFAPHSSPTRSSNNAVCDEGEVDFAGLTADGEWFSYAASLVQENRPIWIQDGEVIPRTPRPIALDVKWREVYLDNFPCCNPDDIHMVERVVVVATVVNVASAVSRAWTWKRTWVEIGWVQDTWWWHSIAI